MNLQTSNVCLVSQGYVLNCPEELPLQSEQKYSITLKSIKISSNVLN